MASNTSTEIRRTLQAVLIRSFMASFLLVGLCAVW